jgi:glycosyltransferase involved in cell wall biosynthesis
VREKIVLGVGTLIPLKGFDMLIKAFAKLEEDEWKLVILGEGPDREELQNLIDELGLRDKVSLPGITKDVERYYKKASIFVLSSRTEGFPGVLCEAIGYGCASIAFDCLTGPSDIIEQNVNGILVEPENINKLSQEIQKLVYDPELRSCLSANSQEITLLLDIKTISNEWILLFDSIKES